MARSAAGSSFSSLEGSHLATLAHRYLSHCRPLALRCGSALAAAAGLLPANLLIDAAVKPACSSARRMTEQTQRSISSVWPATRWMRAIASCTSGAVATQAATAFRSSWRCDSTLSGSGAAAGSAVGIWTAGSTGAPAPTESGLATRPLRCA